MFYGLFYTKSTHGTEKRIFHGKGKLFDMVGKTVYEGGVGDCGVPDLDSDGKFFIGDRVYLNSELDKSVYSDVKKIHQLYQKGLLYPNGNPRMIEMHANRTAILADKPFPSPSASGSSSFGAAPGVFGSGRVAFRGAPTSGRTMQFATYTEVLGLWWWFQFRFERETDDGNGHTYYGVVVPPEYLTCLL